MYPFVTTILCNGMEGGYRREGVTCINCGFSGHTSKNCNFPITSFGVICYKYVRDSLHFLLVQRKDSLCFTEFVRGKYDIKNIGYIKKLFSHMTSQEKHALRTHDFDVLWKNLWVNNTNNLKKEYNISKTRFTKLRNGYRIKSRNANEGILHIDMDYFVDNTPSIAEQEWEFPKGRRKLNESDAMCALREFEEETSISRRFVQFHEPNKQYEEIFIGKNRLRYRNVFYLANYMRSNLDDPLYDAENFDQIKEIKDVRWFTYDDVLSRIENNVEKAELFRRVFNMLMKHLP